MLSYFYAKTNVGFLIIIAVLSTFCAVVECNVDIRWNNCSTISTSIKRSKTVLFRLDNEGIFHRIDFATKANISPHSVTYSVLSNGVLIPGRGPYPLDYKVNNHGDLLPLSSNKCLYKSDAPAYFVRNSRKVLIPVQLVFSGNKIDYIHSSKGSKRERVLHTELLPPRRLIPDTGCNGEVTLFLLSSNGHLKRYPPDEYLPHGVSVRYQLNHDGVLTPYWQQKRGGILTPFSQRLEYLTGEKGNLVPSINNTHTLTTQRETSQSFILAEGGVLAPVREAQNNDSINYFFDGRLIHRSGQFNQIFSNASVVYLTERKKETSENAVSAIEIGPRFECARRLVKRDTEGCGDRDDCPNRPKSFKQCAFVYDDKGKRIPLDPYVNEKGRIAIYKVTCKGLLKRLDTYNEPESGFEVKFKLLDSYILVPITKKTHRVYLRYILQDNGSLVPIKNQKFSYKKAPASMLFYVLTRNKELVPVRLNILKDGSVELYYQECLIYTLEAEQAKNLEIFTTLYSPLYAYLNSRLTIIHHDPLPKPEVAATWSNIGKSATYPCRNLYLIGPNKVKIKIEIDLNKNNVPVIFEMDCKGVCHKSPKDERKNMVLASYKLVAEGMILVPTNQSNGYMYLVDRQGDMYPYCYPETKLRAPHGLTVKYLLCKSGILLPILVEAVADHVRFSYENTVIYYRRAYTIEETLDLIGDGGETKPEDIVYQKEKGDYVYFEKIRKTLFRHPKKDLANYLLGHTAYFNVLPSGTLDASSVPDEKLPSIKIQVQREGNIIIVETPDGYTLSDNYLLAKNASLIPVQVARRDGYLIIYRGGSKITRIKYPSEFENSTTHNSDPMNLFDDSQPQNSTSCPGPQQITIPIEESIPDNQKVLHIDARKCALIRQSIQEMLDKDPSLIGTELEMNDNMVQDIFKMVCNCSSVKCPEWCKGRGIKTGKIPAKDGCR